jgi:YegS/Rv2252/BmrU family lipid kinase
MKRLFIINPKSGTARDSDNLITSINQYFPGADIVFTERKGHARELAAKAVTDGYKQVITAGGDGTINEAVQSLAGSEVALGVIARGSGNGLARELGAPLGNHDLACKAILNSREVRCDLGRANGEYFANLAGVGFEADIAAAFDEQGKTGARGKWPYFKIGAREFFNYKAPRVAVELDGGKTITLRPLTLAFSNGRQYGSGFKIAPKASFTDGLLDMVEIKNDNIMRLILGFPNFFKEGISPIKITKVQKIKKATIKIKGPFYYHIDGEPRQAKDLLEIEIAPAAISFLMRG